MPVQQILPSLPGVIEEGAQIIVRHPLESGFKQINCGIKLRLANQGLRLANGSLQFALARLLGLLLTGEAQ